MHSIGRIDEHGHASRSGYQLTQEFQALRYQLARDKIDTRHITARPREACDQAKPDRVIADGEHNGDCRSRRLGGARHGGALDCGDHADSSAHQFGRQRRQPIVLILGPAVFDGDVLALDIAGVLEGLAKCAQTVGLATGSKAEKPDNRHRRLLRARRARPCRQRPRGRGTAQRRDEGAPPHSITSSARASRVGGISRPSALAVIRLMIRSNLVGCSTGRSLAFAPRNILST